MFITLIRFKIKEFFRSPIWAKSIGLNIVLGFFMVYLLVVLILTGLVIPDLIGEIAPGADKIMIFNSFILFYFTTELVLRFFMQGLPVLSVQPFLHLPVKRSKLANFMIGSSVLTFFNILPLFFAVPFYLRVVGPAFPGLTGFLWLLSILIFSLINNFLLIYFKRQVINNPKIGLSLFLILVVIYVLNFVKVISLTNISVSLFAAFLQNSIYVLIPVIIAGLLYLFNFRFLISNMYMDEIRAKKPKDAAVAKEMRLLKNIGSIGEYVTLEVKLILRNKRPKSTLMLSPLFLLYGLLFYTQEMYMNSWGMLIIIGVFITAGFSLMYGQFFFAWESNYFDTLISKNVDFYSYFRAKFMFVVIVSTTSFIITIPYLFFGQKILFINIASWLFNIGVNSFVLLLFGTFNRKRIELTKGAAFNYQGTGATQFLITIPLLVLPLLIHIPFRLSGIPYIGLIVIGGIGVMGLIFHKYFLKLLVNRFETVRHKMAKGFRQK